jgi:hypothetical protein
MGTWGIQTFDNDAASDWLWDLEETDDASLLEKSLDPQDKDYLQSTEGENVLTAAEIIHGIRCQPRSGLPENALEWIHQHKTLEVEFLVRRAAIMIDRVLSEKSELRSLWEENQEDYPKWKANILELQTKLRL